MNKDILVEIFKYLDNEQLEELYPLYPEIVTSCIIQKKMQNNVAKYYFENKKYLCLKNKFGGGLSNTNTYSLIKECAFCGSNNFGTRLSLSWCFECEKIYKDQSAIPK